VECCYTIRNYCRQWRAVVFLEIAVDSGVLLHRGELGTLLSEIAVDTSVLLCFSTVVVIYTVVCCIVIM
jgi:hypothetical protein